MESELSYCYICENNNLLEIYIIDRFRGNPIARDDWGAKGILEVNVVGNELIWNENYSRLRMRFNENGDCVFYSIFNSIKDVPGYKKYTINLLKKHKLEIGIKIDNGICYNDIVNCIETYNHLINIYL